MKRREAMATKNFRRGCLFEKKVKGFGGAALAETTTETIKRSKERALWRGAVASSFILADGKGGIQLIMHLEDGGTIQTAR